MASKSPSRSENINRRGWALWALTIAVLIALTASVPLLYLPLFQALNGRDGANEVLAEPYYAVIGLTGLVLVFCLYTALKQRELNQMRRALQREEHETEDVRTRLSELSALFQMSTTLNLQLRLDFPNQGQQGNQ